MVYGVLVFRRRTLKWLDCHKSFQQKEENRLWGDIRAPGWMQRPTAVAHNRSRLCKYHAFGYRNFGSLGEQKTVFKDRLAGENRTLEKNASEYVTFTARFRLKGEL
jgi:hypothetical protein